MIAGTRRYGRAPHESQGKTPMPGRSLCVGFLMSLVFDILVARCVSLSFLSSHFHVDSRQNPPGQRRLAALTVRPLDADETQAAQVSRKRLQSS